MKRILVFGASGRVGHALCAELKKAQYDVLPCSFHGEEGIEKADIRDYLAVERIVSSFKPELISHLAAMTNVDECELKPDEAFRINTMGTENIALVAQKFDIVLHYMSTAGVFDGKKETLYTEFDEAIPQNVYGVSKFEGEKIVARLLNRYYITRSGWMIGGGEKDSNFVGKIIPLMLKHPAVNAVNDKFGTPTVVDDFAKQFIILIKTNRYGLYHTVCRNTATRYDIALKIREVLKFDKLEVNAVSSDMFPLAAVRVKSEMLRNYKLDLLGLNIMRPWQEALEEYLLNNFSYIPEKNITLPAN